MSAPAPVPAAAPARAGKPIEGPALTAALHLMDATADLAGGRFNDALRKIDRARDSARSAAGRAGAAFRFVDGDVWAEALAALRLCDEAFASWQVGQIPGRPDDILALTSRVRAALEQAEAA